MNRGSADVHDWIEEGGPRFNEAPIHESGKCTRSTHTRAPISGFNEAPIHESGKWFVARFLSHSGHLLQ